MKICFIDESGCTGALMSATSPVQPVFVIAGIIIDQTQIAPLTTSFIELKKKYFPNLPPAPIHNLDRILCEIKGSEIRRHIARSGRNQRRHALGFLDRLIELFERYDIRIVGRAWIKSIGEPINGRSVYTYSIQSICESFHNHLASSSTQGFVIADSRLKHQNVSTSHSIFTKKFAAVGDHYPHLLELPTFAHSDNHAGIQVADLLCSSWLFPMAAYSYCSSHVSNIHVQAGFNVIKSRYGRRLQNLQHRYQSNGRFYGGITVSDSLTHRPGGHLFT